MATVPRSVANGGTWTAANTPQTLYPEFDLIADFQASGNSHTFTLTVRGNSALTFTKRVIAGSAELLADGVEIEKVSIDSPDGNGRWFWVRHGTWPSYSKPSSAPVVTGSGTFTVAPSPSLIDNQSFPPTSIANGSAESVKQAGANPIASGSLVYYRMTITRGLVTASDIGVYIAIKGETSGVYYAVCGPLGNPSGQFRMPVSEKIDIVAANADTVANEMAASWEAWAQV